MSLMDKLKSWWRKDELEKAEEETRMTPFERDVAEEDYEGRKDDIQSEYAAGRGAPEPDFEADSERPR